MARSNEVSARLRVPRTENTVPWFWPFEFAAAAAEAELSLFKRGLETMAEAEKLDYGLTPKFADKIAIELHTLRLRDFTVDHHANEVATIIDAPGAHGGDRRFQREPEPGTHGLLGQEARALSFGHIVETRILAEL
jgi:hypothetical protein